MTGRTDAGKDKGLLKGLSENRIVQQRGIILQAGKTGCSAAVSTVQAHLQDTKRWIDSEQEDEHHGWRDKQIAAI